MNVKFRRYCMKHISHIFSGILPLLACAKQLHEAKGKDWKLFTTPKFGQGAAGTLCTGVSDGLATLKWLYHAQRRKIAYFRVRYSLSFPITTLKFF